MIFRRFRLPRRLIPICCLPLFFASCANPWPQSDRLHYSPGRQTAFLRQGVAYPPRGAPTQVKMAIAAGNNLQDRPYKWGGGHARLNDTGYDCSGAVSYVLRNARLMRGQTNSRGFLNYGHRGPGRWISIYVRNGHVFMTVAGLRLDTGGSRGRTGPRWKPYPRSTKGYIVRHPPGL